MYQQREGHGFDSCWGLMKFFFGVFQRENASPLFMLYLSHQSIYHVFENWIITCTKGPGKRGHIHGCGHILADTNVSPFARARSICCGHKFCVRDTENVSDFVQKHFVSVTNVSQFAQPKKHHGQQCVLVYQGLKSKSISESNWLKEGGVRGVRKTAKPHRNTLKKPQTASDFFPNTETTHTRTIWKLTWQAWATPIYM